MNLVPLFRRHPELFTALLDVIAGPQVHLVACHDCGLHFPSAEMRRLILDAGCVFVCDSCFEGRQDMAWAEWYERVAKEGREK